VIDTSAILSGMPQVPGVYLMLAQNGEVLYVGKAKDLRKRVASYLRRSGLPPKTAAMMSHVERIDFTRTHTESEALLLENNLIKQHRPRYNIVLRDDKSYPYIHLDDSHQFPRLGFYRGSRKEAGRFFGPYANAGAVRETLAQLQKIFPVRQCEDSFFRMRTRPCLQFQIKRCTAPCVGLVKPERYREDVEQAVLFLEGKDETLRQFLIKQMESAADRLDFEAAARYRDRIQAIQRIQERQYISGGDGNVDVAALHTKQGKACIEVMFIRGGRHNGSKSFFPALTLATRPSEIMSAFLGQFYLNKTAPAEILVEPAPVGRELLETALRSQSGHKVSIRARPRGHRARWLDLARMNAQERLKQHLAASATQAERLEALRMAFDLDATPSRVECFDISHTAGEATVAACVVFDQNGPVKAEYRRYNISDVAAGDDYAALTQALQRRYQKMKEGDGKVPDLVLIDGGKGQLGSAIRVFAELQIEGVVLAGVAKGVTRRPGAERVYIGSGARPVRLAPDSPALHWIQQVRDEAHRFAIAGHRRQRGKSRVNSSLQEIPGIGSKRRQALLRHMGGMQEVARAGIEDLARVPGISPQMARKIHEFFHGE